METRSMYLRAGEEGGMVMKRLLLISIPIVVVAAAATSAWLVFHNDSTRRIAATGGVENTCPPWAPIVRRNAFGKSYCSGYEDSNTYVGKWASTAYADYFWRNLPCPSWAPRQLGSGTIPTELYKFTCSRYDVFGNVVYPLLAAPPPPPKPPSAPEPCSGLPCPGPPPRAP
jgi:hypothetical protein